MSRGEGTGLLEEARQGSPEAVSAVFDRYGVRLHAFIRMRMGQRLRARMESEDILQATLMKAFAHLDQFEGDATGSFMGWLAAIARNEIRQQANFHGRQKRQQGLSVGLTNQADALRATVQTEVSRLDRLERAERLERAFEALSEAHREVILLRNYEELAFAEIGERMGKSPDACRMLLARAMTALTLRMRELGADG